jgi:hypothetical protein
MESLYKYLKDTNSSDSTIAQTLVKILEKYEKQNTSLSLDEFLKQEMIKLQSQESGGFLKSLVWGMAIGCIVAGTLIHFDKFDSIADLVPRIQFNNRK